ncbi:MAG: hypothetical protein MUD14_03115 [Hydrococcus sp. Prado102]|jgi:hypothetical protein|nr:hypothetical protein [Hydrococcus sp. Prado102]
MAADDRKKRIMEHLAKSSDAIKSIAPKSISKEITSATPEPPPPPTPTPEPTPIPTSVKISDRKRRIMEHVNRTSADLADLSQDEKKRKKQVLDHVRKSQS